MAEALPDIPIETSSDALRCGECRCILNDPRILHCLHSFCLRCLAAKCESTAPVTKITCPLCNVPTDVQSGSVLNLPSNVYLKRVLDYRDMVMDAHPSPFCGNCESSAKYRCITCKISLCKQCYDSHELPRHKIKSLNDVLAIIHRLNHEENKSVIFCDDHKEFMIYYCQTCRVLICEKCLKSSHTFHDYTAPEDEARLLRKRVSKELEELKRKQDEMDQISIKYGTYFEVLDCAEQRSIEKLRQIRDEYLDEIAVKFSESESNIHEIFSKVRTKATQELTTANSQLGGIPYSLGIIESFQKYAAAEEILFLQDQIWSRLNDLKAIKVAQRFPDESDVPDLDIIKSKEDSEVFHVSKRTTKEVKEGKTSSPAPIPRHRKPCVTPETVLPEKMSVSNCNIVLDLGKDTIADICWVNRNHLAVANKSRNKLDVFNLKGNLLWERKFKQIEHVAVVSDVVVCDSVDAVNPVHEVLRYHRIYVSSRDGPFPVAKSLFSNKIYVAGINDRQIKIYKKDGKRDGVITLTRAFTPCCLTLNSKYDLYGIEAGQVWKISSAGEITATFKWVKESRKWNPTGLCTDAYDNLFIINAADSTILQLSESGNVLDSLSLPFNGPKGLSVDREGRFLTADINNCVWSFSVKNE